VRTKSGHLQHTLSRQVLRIGSQADDRNLLLLANLVHTKPEGVMYDQALRRKVTGFADGVGLAARGIQRGSAGSNQWCLGDSIDGHKPGCRIKSLAQQSSDESYSVNTK